jgi:uncharacterized protein (TIGR02246 family)
LGNGEKTQCKIDPPSIAPAPDFFGDKTMKRTLILVTMVVGAICAQTMKCEAQNRGSREDEEAIRKIVMGTTDAFNRHDAKAFASFYAADAELVTVRGERMKGAAGIEKGLAAIFATRAKAATLKTLDTTVRFVRPDVAIVHVTNELSGLVSPEGQLLPPHRELSIRVIAKERGRWLVTAFHNTIVRPDLKASESAAPPVLKVDHIMIRTDDPSKLYAFFSETLRLPVAWPMAVRGGVTSGGVGFGNANVEAIRFPGQTRSQTRLVGFGFEPSPLAECLAELDRRGIAYGEPRPFIAAQSDGTNKLLFTNVTLRQFSDADRPVAAATHIFLSEYNPAYVDVAQRRARLWNELQASGGGPLGIKAVKEIVIGATDERATARLWGKLLEPRPENEPGLWAVGDGPAIRVVRATENKLLGLIISVVSLSRAKSFLLERGLLGSVTEKDLTIEPSKVEGLNIRLVEVN